MVPGRNALGKLFEAWMLQDFDEFRLSDQDYLEKLFLFGFKIR